MFIIQLLDLQGVELIIKALRERAQTRGCGASGPLADGIERTVVYVDHTADAKITATASAPKKPSLKVVQ